MATPYDDQFFGQIDETSTRSARAIVPLVKNLLRPKSVLDVGGGIGSWLAVFGENEVGDFVCVDGAYVDRSALRIPPDRFVVADLAGPLDMGRLFDLAICLEVGEHLPAECADTLVDSVVRHADAVLFSAAIPHQGGTHHLNEQWPEYWSAKFRARGYRCFDCVRWAVWSQPSVAWWYKQNVLLYLHERAVAALDGGSPILKSEVDKPPAVVHPDIYVVAVDQLKSLEKLERLPRLPWAVKALTQSAKASVKHHAGRVLGSK